MRVPAGPPGGGGQGVADDASVTVLAASSGQETFTACEARTSTTWAPARSAMNLWAAGGTLIRWGGGGSPRPRCHRTGVCPVSLVQRFPPLCGRARGRWA